ncbi:serine beta-lactamase-like protein LACTB, mitochondrial isoform X1 [Arapaima gigas]
MLQIFTRSCKVFGETCRNVRSCTLLAKSKQCRTGFSVRSRLFTTQPRVRRTLRSAPLWVCALGVSAGSVLVLWLKHGGSFGEPCECEQAENGHGTVGFHAAIAQSRELLRRIKDEAGAPGIVVAVSVDGHPVWSEGLGYGDLENRVPCRPETMMRIASISKPLTTAAVAQLWEQGRLDLDAPVQKYVPEFPTKQFDGEDVTITTRMLLSHLSGIRHYEKNVQKVRQEKLKKGFKLSNGQKDDVNENNKEKQKKSPTNKEDKTKEKEQKKKEFDQEEYYQKEHFENVVRALDMFKDDPLIFKPGTTFLYSTHAFTLLSAVVERASGQRFLDYMMQMFRKLGMLNTVPEKNDPIIYHRSRFYHFNKRGRVINCPYVDNSYKWAGGGFLSTVGDLVQFGNVLLYSYQMAQKKNKKNLLPGFLKPQTVTMLWTPVQNTEVNCNKDGQYGMGWLVVEKQPKCGQCMNRRHYVSHTGSAVGASSVLLVLPSEPLGTPDEMPTPPQGVVVAIITNLQSVELHDTALKIAWEFDKVRKA